MVMSASRRGPSRPLCRPRATQTISWGASSAAIVTSSLSTSGHHGLRGHNLDNTNTQNHLYARNAKFALEEIPTYIPFSDVEFQSKLESNKDFVHFDHMS